MAIIGVALAKNADTATRIVIPFSCDSSLAVGDLVFESSSVDKKVEKAVDNFGVPQVFGICVEKPDTTTAKILILGIATGFTGLTRGGRIFLSATGSLTTTKPSTGYLHNLGVAVSSTEVMFIPNNIRVNLA